MAPWPPFRTPALVQLGFPWSSGSCAPAGGRSRIWAPGGTPSPLPGNFFKPDTVPGTGKTGIFVFRRSKARKNG